MNFNDQPNNSTVNYAYQGRYHHNTHTHFRQDSNVSRPSAVAFDSLDGKLQTATFRQQQEPVSYTQQYGSQIEATDVLCGRGKTSFNHVGNRRFRDLIAASTIKYNDAKSRLEKSMVVHYLVEEVRKINGRFLKQDRFSGNWYELDERHAKEKVGHAIRDATSSIDPKKKILKKTRSNSSAVNIPAPPAKKSPFNDDSIKIPSDSISVGSNASMSESLVRVTTKNNEVEQMDDNSVSIMDPWDDMEPLCVDSLEAQNSLTELQQSDDSLLHRLSFVLGATTTPSTAETDNSGSMTPFRYEIV